MAVWVWGPQVEIDEYRTTRAINQDVVRVYVDGTKVGIVQSGQERGDRGGQGGHES